MVVTVFSLMVQKFLPLRTFFLGSREQAIGESQGLQKEVTHPGPLGPLHWSPVGRTTAPPGGLCPPRDNKTCPGSHA